MGHSEWKQDSQGRPCDKVTPTEKPEGSEGLNGPCRERRGGYCKRKTPLGSRLSDRNLACLKGSLDAKVSGINKNSGNRRRENCKMAVGMGKGSKGIRLYAP